MGEDSSILNTVAKGAALTAFGMFFSKFVSYLFRTIVARSLGQEAYGIVSIGITAFSFMTSISLLAMNQSLMNYIPKYQQRNDQEGIKGIVLSTYHLTLPVSLLISGIMFFGAEFIALNVFKNPNVAGIIRIMAFAPFFSIAGSVAFATTRAMQIEKYHTLVRLIAQPVVQLGVATALIALGWEVAGAGIGWVAGSFISGIAGIWILEKKIGPILTSDVKARIQRRKAIRYSSPLLLSSLIGSVLGWTDTAMLGFYLSEAKVGLYNAALPTAMLLVLPYSALSSLLLPSMSEAVEREDKDLSNVLKSVTRWTMSLTFPAFCLMILFPQKILHLLFGSNYTSAFLALIVLALGQIANASVGHLDTVIKAIDKSDILFKNSLVNALLNIGLNVLLIPRYGILGAAAATTGSIIFSQVLLLIEVYYFEKEHPFGRQLWKPMFSSLLSLGIVYYLVEHILGSTEWWILFPAGLFYGGIYILCYMLLGIEDEDRELIERALDKLLRLTPVIGK